MTIERITYSESVEAINTSGNKKWFKAGIEVADVDNEATKATNIAKEYVSETLLKSLEANPEYRVDPATYNSEIKYTKATDLVKKELSKEQIEASNIAEILSCKELNKLKEFELISKTTPALSATYNTMIKKLSK